MRTAIKIVSGFFVFIAQLAALYYAAEIVYLGIVQEFELERDSAKTIAAMAGLGAALIIFASFNSWLATTRFYKWLSD
ncbi:hypothetical protein CRBSH125_00850 [Afipia carboxidovorans]|nr:hypothetical protein CRBSH125_00850 [Afipia carboxidovorans]